MTSDGLVRVRGGLMGFAGVVCLIYGVLALVTGQPDPMHPAIPGMAGLAAAVAIFLAFGRASAGTRKQATDEVFQMEMNAAVTVGFWVAILLYPMFAPFLMGGLITFEVAFAAMGTLTAAAYLLTFAFQTLRGL